VFSRVLVPALTRPGLDLTALAFDVREEVARVAASAGYVQEPSYYDGTIGGRVYLAGLPPPGSGNGGGSGSAGVPPATMPPSQGEAPDDVAWGFLRDTGTAEQLRRFIAQYPVSSYRRKAEERLRRLEQTNVAMTLPAWPAEAAKPAGSPCSQAAAVPLPQSRNGAWSGPLSAAEECGLKLKDVFQECADCPEMVVVPAGSFTMGAPDREKGRSGDEGPQHVVAFARPFAAGRLHVTVRQFAAYVNETGSSSKNWRNPYFAQDGSHPVVEVTWHEAKAYVDWLAAKTGKPYRLLSEAEWEYAARGQTSPGAYPHFWFGDDEEELCRYGNFRDQAYGEASAPCNDGYERTSPAGHYQPNAFGLYDMFGNAWQWTADCWHDDYQGAPTDGSAWTAGNCLRHALRGGGWNDTPGEVRVARRKMGTTNNKDFGFRVARTLGL
jgi:formylglycine-generating enzyme required for sulfatase activity